MNRLLLAGIAMMIAAAVLFMLPGLIDLATGRVQVHSWSGEHAATWGIALDTATGWQAVAAVAVGLAGLTTMIVGARR